MAGPTRTSGLLTSDGVAASVPYNLSGLPAIGTLIILPISVLTDSGQAITVSDNQGNTWVQAAISTFVGSNNRSEIWAAMVTAASGTFTITIVNSGSAGNTYYTYCIDEWLGMQSSTKDKSNSDNNGGSTTATPTTGSTGTLSQANEVAYAVLTSGTSAALPITTSPAGFTASYSVPSGLVHEYGEALYKEVAATTALQGDWIISLSVASFSAAIATFKKSSVVAVSSRQFGQVA